MIAQARWSGLCCPEVASGYFHHPRRRSGSRRGMIRRMRPRWKGRAANYCDSGWIARCSSSSPRGFRWAVQDRPAVALDSTVRVSGKKQVDGNQVETTDWVTVSACLCPAF